MKLFLYCILCYIIYYLGYSYGTSNTELIYNKEINRVTSIIIKLQQENEKLTANYYNKVSSLTQELYNAKQDYTNKFNSINNDVSNQLLQSKSRAEYYRKQASSCSIKSRNLAEHTAQLDEQLTKGIILVKELRELIKYRDNQLRTVGKQLLLDRELINDRFNKPRK